MKHAFLIIAHNEPSLFKRLCLSLDHNNVDIYVHIDRKSNIDDFYVNLNHSRVIYVKDRISVTWGGYSQIETELLLFSNAAETGEYSYYHLISGVDVLLKPISSFLSFFELNRGYQFLGSRKADILHFERVSHYHFYVNRTNWSTRFCKVESIIQRILGIKRINEAYFGDNWCSISNDFVCLILSKRNWIKKHFRYTKCGDEIYKQSIFHLFGMDKGLVDKGSIRLIDWDRGQPYTFTIQDLPQLLSTDRYIARKFSSQHMDIVDAIEQSRQAF